MARKKVSISQRFSRIVVFVLLIAPATGVILGAVAYAFFAQPLTGSPPTPEGLLRAMLLGAEFGATLALITAWTMSQYPLLCIWLMVTLPAAGLFLPLIPAFGRGSIFTGILGYVIGWAALTFDATPSRCLNPDYMDAATQRVGDDNDCDDDFAPPI